MDRRLFVLAIPFLLFTAVATGADFAWKAGAAKVAITPEQPMWMAGYAARTRPADGKLTELWAKSLVLEDQQGNRGVVVTLDLVGIDRTLSQAICDSLKEQYSLPREQIVICTSHTHSGPVVGQNLAPLHYRLLAEPQQRAVDAWVSTFQKQVVALVGEAIGRLAPSELRWGSGTATFAVNRRDNSAASVPQLRTEGKLQGFSDHDVPVLAVRDADENLIAVLFGYACHATTLSGFQWSGDYPGYAQIELEKEHPGCVALFFAGCGADQNPLPRKTVQLAKHYGQRLATAVDSVLMTSQMHPVQGTLRTTYAEIDLPFDTLPTREEIELNSKSANRYEVARATMLREQIEGGVPLSQTYPYPISAWSIGDDLKWVALGGEVVVDYAIRLKSELAGTGTWVAGYANDVMAYIPSRRVLREGGYEGGGAMVYYGLPAAWAPALERDIVQEVHRQIDLASDQRVIADETLIASISKETLWRNRDGKSQTWFHPRACMMPGVDGKPVALMTLQQIGGSDYFGQVHWSTSSDLGQTWSDPKPIAALGRAPVPGHDDDLKAAVCDVVPQYDPIAKSLLAMGHVVFYKGDYFARKEQLSRYPVYVTRDQDGTWSERKILQWDDPRGSNIYSNGCGQRVVLPNGDVLLSFTFGPKEINRMVSGVHASFDGERLKVKEVGPALRNDKGRGLLEPSVTEFDGKFWITMRAEDNRGYVSVSDDGLNYEAKQAWAWDDGTPIEMSTTQQHWLTHSDGLFLVYTRQDQSNEKVMRWRSPLWVAQVDTDKRCLIKSTEQLVLPLVGDGIDAPNKVALMGNFHVTHASPQESWVTVGEWMPQDGYRGDVLLARIRWSKPNRLPLW
ncbi:neutral/alkaline non-lysosomal ceramidase N-terminal domain-containing protein [Planctomycetes bacterium K23_9]|uniref:Neutral ceramidase n=1 Tax=Stieleria marina TaxID=1930275 RepID=A0A517NRC8_9BACT|nr:Neutral ceramidase precursor [Planctomycetes bacterium K23_9]